MTDRELMQQALDALANFDLDVRLKVMPALRARLSQCDRCGEVNPAEIHTCTPKQAYPENFIDALRYHTAINEQPEQEPVAWYYAGSRVEPESVALDCDLGDAQKANCTPLYTAPPQREWQGLTEVERIDIIDEEITAQSTEHFALAQAIEAKLKEKNT